MMRFVVSASMICACLRPTRASGRFCDDLSQARLCSEMRSREVRQAPGEIEVPKSRSRGVGLEEWVSTSKAVSKSEPDMGKVRKGKAVLGGCPKVGQNQILLK